MTEVPLLMNRYQLEKPLGSGGMAVVYRGRDQMLERSVAIKVLREDYSRDPAFRERFRQEAKAAANLSHPNIVTVHDFGMDSGRLFIVMEYVPGTNLHALLQARGRFSVEEALPLIQQACAGVGYAHRAGLVHCDIKPHNFLISPDNRLKVTDFGIARALASIEIDERSDVVWGSPQYFSPEQASGAAPSPASDVYALGIVLYAMLTGRLPFIAASVAELAEMHRSAPPVPPRSYNPAIPETLEQIILKVLSKEPAARYRTADQLGRVLIAFGGGAKDPAPTPAAPAPARPAAASKLEATLPPPTQQATVVARPAAARPQSPPAPGPRPRPIPPQQRPTVEPMPLAETAPNPFDIDWASLGLGLTALVFILGLIPLWVAVYYAYNSPLP